VTLNTIALELVPPNVDAVWRTPSTKRGRFSAFVRRLAVTEPVSRRALMLDLYKRVIDGAGELEFPLSMHFEAASGVSAPAFEMFAAMVDYWSPSARCG
jgi:Mycobacterial methylenetetrahydrofolate reductase